MNKWACRSAMTAATMAALCGCEAADSKFASVQVRTDEEAEPYVHVPVPAPPDEPRLYVEAMSNKLEDGGEAPCPKSSAGHVQRIPYSHVKIAEHANVINTAPLRWTTADTRHVYELREGAELDVIDLGSADEMKAATWDDAYWFRRRCYEDCDGRTSMGIPTAVERIDRVTGERKRLSKGYWGLTKPLPRGSYVYWGIFGHGIGGGVFRVGKDGSGEVELRLQDKSVERVEELTAMKNGLLATTENQLLWFPDGEQLGRELMKVRESIGGAVVDGDAAYIAEYGKRYWDSKPSGYIHRVRLDGTDFKTLAGPVQFPQTIAVHGDTVFYMLRKDATIYAVPTTGGEPRVALLPRFDEQPCNETTAMWSTSHGLVWQRSPGGFLPVADDTLWFAPWSMLELPNQPVNAPANNHRRRKAAR